MLNARADALQSWETRPRHIGIVMMSAIGDAVHVLPLICALKRCNPAPQITWILEPAAASLVRGHDAVDEIVIFERSRGWRAFLDVKQRLRGRVFDVVLDLQVYLKAGIVTALMNARVKLGFDHARARDLNWLFTTQKISRRPMQHVQDQYFEFLEVLGVPPEPLEWRLGPWEDERPWQTQFLTRFERPIAPIVVATSKHEKDWPAERWAEVADALYYDFGLAPVLVGGCSKRELLSEHVILGKARCRPHSTLGSGLRRLVSILDASALVLSPDTGPLHMSVALDRPVISLIGYSNPLRVGPYRRFRDLLIDAYGEPGEKYFATTKTRPGRMDRITVKHVLEKIEHWRTNYSQHTSQRGHGCCA